MNCRKCSQLTLFTLLTFLLGVSHAQAAELDGDTIARFIDSLVALQPLQEKYEGESWASAANGTDKAGRADGITLMSDSLEAMKGHEAYAEVAKVVEAHDFSDPEQWARVGDRIFKAYAAASMEAEQPGSRRQMEEAMRELENADMPAAQKEMMRQSMGNAMATIKSLTDAPQADIEAVQPYMAEIERAFVADTGAPN